jgi:hypothetical protein
MLYFKASVVQWKDIRPWRPEFGPEGMHFVSGNSRFFFYFWGSSEAAMDGGGAQRPVGRGNRPNKTSARSARARTRGQNPLVSKYGYCQFVKDLSNTVVRLNKVQESTKCMQTLNY